MVAGLHFRITRSFYRNGLGQAKRTATKRTGNLQTSDAFYNELVTGFMAISGDQKKGFFSNVSKARANKSL